MVRYVAIEPTRDLKRWRNLERIEDRLCDVRVGFESDGGSIPRIFWIVTGHPINIHKYPAYFIHDNLYCKQTHTRKQVDDHLYELLIELNTCKFRAWIIWFGVRIGGWYRWNIRRSYQ